MATEFRDNPDESRYEIAVDGELSEVRASLCRCDLSENRPFCDHACKRADPPAG